MDPLTAEIKFIKNKQVVLSWISNYLRYEIKLDKYNSTSIKRFLDSTFKKSEQLDQRRLMINLDPYIRDKTTHMVSKLIKIIQLCNTNSWTTLKLHRIAGINNQVIYNYFSAKCELLCFNRERGGDYATIMIFGPWKCGMGEQRVHGKIVYIEENKNSN